MSDRLGSAFDALRREEYTGANRCLPCTVVNVAIAALLSAVVAAVVAVELAAAVFGVSALAIYLRGYLVPGTPTLTKRYLPERVLKAFDDHPLEDDGPVAAEEKEWETLEELDEYRRRAVDPEQFLLDVGAVEPCDGGADLRYTSAFERRLETELESLTGDADGTAGSGRSTAGTLERRGAVDAATLAAVFDVDPADVRFEDRDYPAVEIGRRIRKWPSDEALVLDVATHAALVERSSRWEDVPRKQRIEILRSLRSFQGTCPGCGGPVTASEGLVESCCAQYEVVSVGCADCGAHLLELDPAKLDETGGFEP